MTAALGMTFVLLQLWRAISADYIQPTAHTLSCPPQSTANGSITCGCPPSCIHKSGVWTCECSEGSGQYGYMIDGEVPQINVSTSTWASHLFTWKSGGSYAFLIGFEFQESIVVREVEVYLFYCPLWSIGYPRLTVYIGRDFPNTIELVGGDLGSAQLTGDMENCEKIIRVSIPLRYDHVSTTYSLEFGHGAEIPREWIHIAEVKFSDQLIPASIPITTTTIAATAAHSDFTSAMESPVETSASRTFDAPAPPKPTTSSAGDHPDSSSATTDNPSSGNHTKTTVTVVVAVLVAALCVCVVGIVCVVCGLKLRPSLKRASRQPHEELEPCLYDATNNDENVRLKEEEIDGRVKSEDINFLVNELYDLATRWRFIGMGLGFRQGELDNIESQAGRDPVNHLTRMLAYWTEWPTARHKDQPTLEQLCNVLKSKMVGAGKKAIELEGKGNLLPSMRQN